MLGYFSSKLRLLSFHFLIRPYYSDCVITAMLIKAMSYARKRFPDKTISDVKKTVFVKPVKSHLEELSIGVWFPFLNFWGSSTDMPTNE